MCLAVSSGAVDDLTGMEQTVFDSGASVTVLIYHRFGEDRYPSTNVSMERFSEQLSFLKDKNYTVLPLAEVVRILASDRPLPEKAVAITIDDGYKSVYEKAWPLLRTFGYPFTVFLYTKATDNKHWDYMTWDQVREMRQAGVDFQDHGYAHHRLGGRLPAMNEKEYFSWIKEDFRKSAGIIKKELGYQPTMLAFPYGEYNRTVVDAAEELGYSALFTQDPGSVSKATDVRFIPREPILGTDWSSMEHFAMVLERVDLPIIDMVPDMTRLQHDAPRLFSTRLLYPERYIDGTVGIYVSELGWRAAARQGEVVTVKNERKLQRRLNRVAVSAREKGSGKTAIRFWLLINEQVAGD